MEFRIRILSEVSKMTKKSISFVDAKENAIIPTCTKQKEGKNWLKDFELLNASIDGSVKCTKTDPVRSDLASSHVSNF